MKLLIEQSDAFPEPEILIRCERMDRKLENIAGYIRLQMFSVSGTRDGETRVLPLDDVFYFESIDERTFLYLEQEVYECAMRLYELEKQLEDTHFVRISKSCIVNILKLDSVRPLLNSRYEATLENGEKLIINRHYLPAFKSRFGIS